MSRPTGPADDPEDAVATYKQLLRTYLDRRPSGTRLRIAAALNIHKSFISQVTNPTYRVPLPAQHIPKIIEICHFSPEERESFLAAYHAAHPEEGTGPSREHGSEATRTLRLEVPDLGDPQLQRELEATIRDMSARICNLIRLGMTAGTEPQEDFAENEGGERNEETDEHHRQHSD